MSSARVASIVVGLLAAVLVAWMTGRDGATPAPVEPGPSAPAPPPRPAEPPAPRPSPPRSELPPEAYDTLARIHAGGPFRYRQDGGVFGNYEGKLPKRPRGHYHEYTVETPGSKDRGARRIVTGGTPPTEYFYTSDHYESFRPFDGAR